MIRLALAVSAVALAACAPPVPDSGAPSGVGFGDYRDYNSYRAAREVELRSTPPTVLPPAPPVRTAAIDENGPITTATLSQAGIGRTASSAEAAAPVAPAPAPAPVVAAARPPAAAPVSNTRISDEQDFSAVSNRQSIQSDAERLRAQRQAYQVVQPTAVPSREGAEGPNIVQYAISTRNPVGQKVYSRSAFSSGARFARNCGKYASPDLAQEAFLASGGPERDRLGVDPDGDGFACGWDPTPFRRVSAANG